MPNPTPSRVPRTSPGAASRPVQSVRNRRHFRRAAAPLPGSPPTAPAAPVRTDGIATNRVLAHLQSWALDGQAAGWSERTAEMSRFLIGKLHWWLQREGHEFCATDELRGFLIYIRTAHTTPEGRWGGEGAPTDKRWQNSPARFKAPSPATVRGYWRVLRAFFNWLLQQGRITSSPLEAIKEPIERSDQIRPFTAHEMRVLIAEAKRSFARERDHALILFLLDTGLRASELCALQYGDVDLVQCRATIRHGKGEKEREVFWSSDTARALASYLGVDGRQPDNPLFTSESGSTVGAALTRGGLLKIIHRLGEAAGLDSVRCSPHTFRHTFAVMYLLAGGDAFSLQQRLGHENPAMTQRYVNFSRANMEVQARQFSPVKALKKAR